MQQHIFRIKPKIIRTNGNLAVELVYLVCKELTWFFVLNTKQELILNVFFLLVMKLRCDE
jgi:hypothetical protein